MTSQVVSKDPRDSDGTRKRVVSLSGLFPVATTAKAFLIPHRKKRSGESKPLRGPHGPGRLSLGCGAGSLCYWECLAAQARLQTHVGGAWLGYQAAALRALTLEQ